MPEVRRAVVLPVPRERAWELLTDPAELEAWLADEVELEDAEPGAALRATWASGETREGVVEEVDPERGLRFTWASPDADLSEVEWRLEDVPGGTRVVVVERSLVPAGGWGPRLQALAGLASAVLA